MSRRPDAVPDYLLEQYVLGELPPGEMSDLAARIANDLDLQGRLARLRAEDEAILQAMPPAAFAAAVRNRLGETDRESVRVRRSLPRWVALAPALAAAAVVLLLVRPALNPGSNDPGREITRTKGDGAALHVYRCGASGVDTLTDGATAAAGDVLQLGYASLGRAHGVVVSIDGRGTVTLHFPAGEDQTTRLRPGGETLLPHAYELDDAPAFERFYLVTGAAPIDVARVLGAARTLAAQLASASDVTAPPPGDLALPGGLEQTAFTVIKEGSRP